VKKGHDRNVLMQAMIKKPANQRRYIKRREMKHKHMLENMLAVRI